MKGMSNNQIILSEAEKLAPATLHAIATAHHTAAQIEALAAQITVTEDDGTQHPHPGRLAGHVLPCRPSDRRVGAHRPRRPGHRRRSCRRDSIQLHRRGCRGLNEKETEP